MTSELGERQLEGMKEQLNQFENGDLALHQLIASLEALLGLLLDEANPEWIAELETECNRLEFSHAASINDARELSAQERSEVRDAIQQMRLILTRY